ncbi:MAG: Glucose-6-phosphate isomerase [ANME-2 cluster archaeon HR1]|nr:MAG: Glucose-6-phosphate isomerase [ANME-2 cluster archaeon HR1]
MNKTLKFGNKTANADIRKLSDIIEVLLDRDILQSSDRELYYMYRDLSLSRSDYDIIKAHHLRYDITIIPPGMVGREYVKTKGHYHPKVPGTDHSYPEVYEVLGGEACYLLQKKERGIITDVILIRAFENDKVIIPPEYGHVTINASNKELTMANWISDDFSSVYKPYVEHHGAAYYMVQDGLIPNPCYEEVPQIREVVPKSLNKEGFLKNKEIYGLVRDIEKLDFLNRPQDFEWDC